MLYLIDSGKFTKIEHTFDLEEDLIALRFNNPNFRLSGYRIGSEEDLDVYKFRCMDYFVDDFGWMKLPRKLHDEIQCDFIVYQTCDKLSLLDIFDLPELSDKEKKVLYYILDNSGYYSRYENKITFYAGGLSNKKIDCLGLEMSGASFKNIVNKLVEKGLMMKTYRVDYELNPKVFNMPKYLDFLDLKRDSSFVQEELLRGKA